MFKQFRDMTKLVQAAPGLIDQANALAAQSEAHRRQMDVMAVQAMTAEPAPGALEPIAGVDLSVLVMLLILWLLHQEVSYWLEGMLLGQRGFFS